MRDKIRIELSSESRLGWEPFYAVLDLPATAQQIRDARQKARITGREDMTYQSVTMVEFEPLPNLEHIRLDTTSVEELNYLASGWTRSPTSNSPSIRRSSTSASVMWTPTSFCRSRISST